MKILLCNWTHRHNTVGGTENRYAYLKQIFPDAELISHEDLFGSITNHIEAAGKMDEYYLERFKEDKDILIIRDAEVGGVLDTSEIPQITIFGNPYFSLNEKFKREYWHNLIKLQKSAEKTIKVAVSNFMKEDMKKNGLEADFVIPNPVDIGFFNILNKVNLRKKYNVPIFRKIGMWVGAEEYKNLSMIKRLAVNPNIFWILVFKEQAKAVYRNVKSFSKVNKETMRELYNCADFFILTSPIEGCNHAIFEAMACNVPCIVSKAGYFWDFWDERIGYRVNSDNWEEHLSAVHTLYTTHTGLSPRQVLIDQKLDLNSWKEKWKELVK